MGGEPAFGRTSKLVRGTTFSAPRNCIRTMLAPVNAIETDKYDPSLPLTFKISKLFRLPIEQVFEP